MTMNDYISRKSTAGFPRLPLEANIDLTYRCNNDCLHCWLRVPPDSPESEAELTFEEIRRIVEDARAMGCRSWAISGGEPMLRPDFAEILEYIQGRSASYALNTNGTLITPRIAGLMKKPGFKMIALYGATPDVHDGITRNPGSFEAFRRGVSYLREAGAGFTVQIVPMKNNLRAVGADGPAGRIAEPGLEIGRNVASSFRRRGSREEPGDRGPAARPRRGRRPDLPRDAGRA